MMALSRILSLLPLLLSGTALFSPVDARRVSGSDSYGVSNGAPVSIPANYTVPLAPPKVATAAQTGPPPPGVVFTTALPAPPANMTLKYIALVRGTWNYTCENSTDAAEPDSIGGVATLYDLAPLIPYLKSEDDLHKIPFLAVNVSNHHIQQVFNVDVLGTFYHPEPHTAIIDLGKKGYFTGATAGFLVRVDSSGPGAPLGPDGSGALGWLIGVAQPGSVGLAEFYRVEVAGGVEPPTCEGRPFLNAREFACEYWIYG